MSFPVDIYYPSWVSIVWRYVSAMVSPEKFTELLGREHVFTILKLTNEPISAAEIIKQSTVPQATVIDGLKN